MNGIRRFKRQSQPRRKPLFFSDFLQCVETYSRYDQNLLFFEKSPMLPEATVQEILKALRQVTPGNIHMKTNASYGERVDFESIWYGHSADAARYYLLPPFVAGKLFILNELPSAK